jgi:chromosome segregation ATPase
MNWIAKNAPVGKVAKSRPNGMKEKPLFDAIETCRYIVPPLHTMLGVGNGLLTNFKEFVDELLEDTPPALQVLRVNEMNAGKEWSEAKMDVDKWTTLNGPELASYTQTQKDIKDILQHEADYPEASEQEIKELKAEIPILANRITTLKNAQRQLLENIKAKAKAWGASRKMAKDFCKTKNTAIP